MVNGINGLNSSILAKLQNVNYADGLNEEEAKAAGLTQAELDEIKAAGVVVDDKIKLDIETEAATANTKGAENNTTANIEMPAETIDETATLKLKSEIMEARTYYNLAKDEAEELTEKIDKKEDEYEALQSELKNAVSDLEDAAIDANEEVCIEVNKIRQQAQAEGWPESKLKAELGKIGIPSLSGEERTLESVGIEIGDLAKVITELSDLYASQADTVDALAEQWGGFLQIDLNTVYVDLTGRVVVNEAGSGGPEVSGENGVSTIDMQKFANMTNEQLTEYLQGNEGNGLLTAMQGMANEGVNLSASDCAAVLKTMIAEQDKSTGDINKFGTQYADNLQVNIVNGASKEELEAAIKKINKKEVSAPSKSCDPYIVNIGGKEYTMILDNNDGKWDTNDILGINDSKDNLFEALKKLESDGDSSKLTGEELAKAGIRLVAKNEDGTLAVNDKTKDFDLSKIDNIDMKNLTRSTDNDGNVGTFGNFNLTLKDGTVVKGAETFEEKSTLDKLFGAVKELFSGLGNVVSDIIDRLKIDKEEKQWYSEGIKEKVATALKDSNGTVDEVLYSSDELLDESLRRTEEGVEGYSGQNRNGNSSQNNEGELSEEEKRKLASQRR